MTLHHCLPILLLAASTSCATYKERAPRPHQWGQPIELAGVRNLHKIDENLYRSAQPTAEGMKNLEKMGIRTIINLRTFTDNFNGVAETRLNSVNIPMLAWMPQKEAAQKFLETVSDKAGGPYLVHCYHGADRTGSMTALYRVHTEKWHPQKAIDEMLYGGYGFHKIWQHLIRWTKQEAQ